MFCGKCGKEMSNTEKFCPHCGAANPNAGAGRPAPGVKPASPGQLLGKNLYQLALIVLGAVHALFFFFISYGQMGDRMVRQFASELGFKMFSSLTGANVIKFYGKLAEHNFPNAKENYYTCIFCFGLPLVMGLLVALVNLLNRSKKVYTLSIVFTALALLGYLMVQVTLPIFENMYFTLNNHMMMVFLITIVQLAVAILGQVKNKAEVRKTSPV